jgi:uncharacterized cupredoxin-like copper-binding protein
MPDAPADVVDPGSHPGLQSRPRMPRWVKIFGIIGIVFAVLVILMLTGVLGKGHGPGRHLGGGMPHKTTTNIGGPADAAGAGRTIEVNAVDTLAFEPSTIGVSAGETVTFSVTNGGKIVHEFTLGDSTMQQQHAGMMAHIPAGMGHDTPNSITLEPGETKRLTWRFGDAGTLEYACHIQGHYDGGMRGRITIN